MENKKGSIGIIIAIILIILFLIAIVVLVFVLSGKGVFKPKNNEVPTIPMFIMPRDKITLEPVESNYVIEYTNDKQERIVVSEGNFDNSWNEVDVPRDYRLTVICWSDKYYLVKAYKDIVLSEINENKSIFTCDMDRIGNLTIIHSGSISGVDDEITLNISTEDAFYKTAMCFSWTSGIIDVGLKNQYVICEDGSWKNWSKYDAKTMKFTYLPNNTYTCGEDWTETCVFAQGKKCKVENELIPIRFKDIADSCVYTGKSLRKESYELEIEVKSFEYKNSYDYIDIYFYDRDRRWDPTEQKWIWFSEINGKDIASPDVIHRIEYARA